MTSTLTWSINFIHSQTLPLEHRGLGVGIKSLASAAKSLALEIKSLALTIKSLITTLGLHSTMSDHYKGMKNYSEKLKMTIAKFVTTHFTRTQCNKSISSSILYWSCFMVLLRVNTVHAIFSYRSNTICPGQMHAIMRAMHRQTDTSCQMGGNIILFQKYPKIL